MKEKLLFLINKTKEDKGFTFLELIIVIGILSILSQIGLDYYISYRAKAFDAAAINDGRQLVNAVVNNLVAFDDVDYSHDGSDDNRVGAFDTSGNPREPVLYLSPSVRARLLEGENDNTGEGFMQAYLYSEGGTRDTSSPSGRREFYCIVDESTGETYFSLE
ncbi:MAG: prepilin-type N-terminal cleavage/methylation domain-containing protein [Desulfobacterales bacterium]|jgi:prepilin-type N-terminal cleavage/methylation domain-containing protein|nr:prepilin-type N-terminal cleavage/methylation domain-containing protein [Desulfobacterales bacterium]